MRENGLTAAAYTSATEASFVYLIKPVLATLLAVVCFRETISVNRMIGIVFFLAASLCVIVPTLRELRQERAVQWPPHTASRHLL